jgi:cobalt/nickel transport protein
MPRSRYATAALALGILLIVALALVLDARRPGDQERFVGSDSAATTAIETAHPDYEPWFSPVLAPTSGEVESGLFALQAALGGIVLGYCFGALRRRRRDEPVDAGPRRG